MGKRPAALLLLTMLAAGAAAGSALEEARALREEGLALLKEARSEGGDLIAGSKAAIAKFEAAVLKLKGRPEGSREAELRTEINSLLFWTRRTTPMDLSAISVRPSQAPKSPAALAAEARAEFDRAEAYARAHPGEPVSVAARFFELANRYKEVHDVAFKAISRAQHYQRLAKERGAEAEFEALTADGKLVVEGDRACAKGRYDRAAAKYREAIAVKPTAARQRKLGHALFGRAQEHRDLYSKVYLRELKDYVRAKRRGDKRGMARAAARAKAVGQIARQGIEEYVRAEAAFKAAWEMSDRFDIDSELHMALTQLIRSERYHKKRAGEILERILRTYHGGLKTDEERTLYAYAETYAGPATVERIRREIARRLPEGAPPGSE